ncbi:MAG: hypothetical protein IPI66_10575 [Chitinophagaceae bacterium]|nr:hypothetical protein [Chitinophagaceae bacterium]MBL0055319.1 hypothetical protein [Chitinophagaceae bacterium]
MFKKIIVAAGFFGLVIAAKAQTVSEALKMLNYERYGSAAQMLEKITVREPANAEAWYWLAQVYLQQPDRDLEKSRSVIESGSSKNRNNLLLEVARAQIGLLGNDASGADQQLRQLYSANSQDLRIVKAIIRARLSAATRSSYSGLTGEALRSASSKFESLVINEKEKYKSQLTKAYAYLAGHYTNSGTNKEKAIGYIKKYLELDPGNAQMKAALEKLGGQ